MSAQPPDKAFFHELQALSEQLPQERFKALGPSWGLGRIVAAPQAAESLGGAVQQHKQRRSLKQALRRQESQGHKSLRIQARQASPRSWQVKSTAFHSLVYGGWWLFGHLIDLAIVTLIGGGVFFLSYAITAMPASPMELVQGFYHSPLVGFVKTLSLFWLIITGYLLFAIYLVFFRIFVGKTLARLFYPLPNRLNYLKRETKTRL